MNTHLKKSIITIFLIAGVLNQTTTFSQTNASDMVQLQTGDFNYNIPLMTVPGPGGGYPITLYYTPDAAARPDAEASWVGLGWNINPGSIHRTKMGIPDDWNNKSTQIITSSQVWNMNNGYLYKTSPGTSAGSTYNPGNFPIYSVAKENLGNYGSFYYGSIVNSNNTQNTIVYQGNNNYWLKGNYTTDVYSNPTSFDDYKDASKQAGNNTLPFANYDYYTVTGPGISGSISPKWYEFRNLLQSNSILKYKSSGSKDTEVKYYDNSNSISGYQKSRSQVYFQFNGDPTGYSVVTPVQIQHLENENSYTPSGGTFQSTVPNTSTSFYNSSNQRCGQGKYIEYFTNSEIINGYTNAVNRGFIETPSQLNQRNNSNLYDLNGIGAFSITTEDGTTYHYSVPVYQFEEYVIFKDASNAGNYVMHKNMNMYATDWLLTAITGADYIDKGTNGMIDDADEGYYVQFNYGKWTDGFIWRSPFRDGEYIPGPIGSGYQSFAVGRKQIYYLNSIQTKTHTAYFVKSLRNDGAGKNTVTAASYQEKVFKSMLSNSTCASAIQQTIGSLFYTYNGEAQQTDVFNPGIANSKLKLDKIILLNNVDAANYSTALSGNNNGGSNVFASPVNGTFTSTSTLTKISWNAPSGNFTATMSCNLSNINHAFQSHYQNNVLDKMDVQNDINNIEQISLSEMEFNQDYLLCLWTPNSSASRGNKLTLKTLKTYGIGKTNLAPPYTFSYKNEKGSSWSELSYNYFDLDSWGYVSNARTTYNFTEDIFNKSYLDAWCLNDIITPSGEEIKVTYESDTYSKEAVFGNLSYTITPNISTIRISNNQDYLYCNINESVQSLIDNGVLSLGKSYRVIATNNISFDYYLNLFSMNTTTNELIFSLTVDEINYVGNHWHLGRINGLLSNVQLPVSTITVPVNKMYGGGTRVKQISTNDGVGHTYTTSYTYNDPVTNNTSGVTSYAPRLQDRYIPYMHELPSPGVMYEYVTVENLGTINTSVQKTRYHFDVLSSGTSSGSSDFSIGDKIKLSGISNVSISVDLSSHFGRKAITAVLEDNTSAIGRLLDVTTMNQYNQPLNTTTYQYYKPGTDTYANGISEETFGEIKNLLQWTDANSSGTQYVSNSIFSITSFSKLKYPSLLKSITTVSNNIKQISNVLQYDIYSGAALVTETNNPDGTVLTNTITTAFSQNPYANMGSKIFNINNKNILSQTAQSQTIYKDGNGVSKTVAAKAQVWSNSWNYWDYDQNSNSFKDVASSSLFPSWHPQKSYAWKTSLNNDGSFNTSFASFNFSSPASSDSHWQKIGEVTHYDHFSNPTEKVDLNTVYSSGKMCKNNRYPVAASAASSGGVFTHAGFEDFLNTSYYEGEVMVNSSTQLAASSSMSAHTGNYMAQLPIVNDIFNISATPFFKCQQFQTTDKGRTYKASVWVHKNSSPTTYIAALLDGSTGYNIQTTSLDGASNVTVGNWVLLTVTINVPANYTPSGGPLGYNGLYIYVVNLNGTGTTAYSYIDDLRVQPIDSPVAGYIYDNRTGLKTAVLDNDNFATYYTYDGLGRVIEIDKETTSGVKKIKQTEYHIANQ